MTKLQPTINTKDLEPSYQQPQKKKSSTCLLASAMVMSLLVMTLGIVMVVWFSMSLHYWSSCDKSNTTGTSFDARANVATYKTSHRQKKEFVPPKLPSDFNKNDLPRFMGDPAEIQRPGRLVNPFIAKRSKKLSPHTGSQKTDFEFDDMWRYYSYVPSASWLADTNKVYYFNHEMELVLHDVDTNKIEVIMDNSTFIQLPVWYVIMSEDLRYVMLVYDVINAIQDVDMDGRYKIYDREAAPDQRLIDFPNDPNMAGKILPFAGWAPTGHSITFVYKNDMYYQKSPYDRAERLTTTGAQHQIRNGLSFWNYRWALWSFEEHWWSPDLKYLAYGSFNSSEVYTSEHPVYGAQDRVYPYIFNQVYLKAGDPHHFGMGTLLIKDMLKAGRPDVVIQPPTEFRGKDHYMMSVTWRNAKSLVVSWCDRSQTHYIVEICDVTTQKCIRNYEKKFKDGWIQRPPIEMLIDDGSIYLTLSGKSFGGNETYQQVAFITLPETGAGQITYLTNEQSQAYYIVGYDKQEHVVYYMGTAGDSLEYHLMRVGTPAAEANNRPVKCMTCQYPDSCRYLSTSFSYSTDYYVETCNGPGVPIVALKWTRQNRSLTIEDNSYLEYRLSFKNMPTKEWKFIDIGDGYKGWAEFTFPPGMVKDGSVKYPVIFFPYAGPHGHTQADRSYKNLHTTGGGWAAYLASSHDVITVRLNGRGSGGRADEFLYAVYRRLGTHEIQDQIAGARSLQKLPYVDSSRIAVWGWSYGGFTSSHVIGDPSKVINCGLAVAPVTNFRWYYSGYTERYMDQDTKEDNQAGYNGTDVARKAANFHGKKYFLAHGTLDDNVHYQMAAQLMKALNEEQVRYRTMVYVDENHGIRDYYQHRHLFLTMTDFLLNECRFGE